MTLTVYFYLLRIATMNETTTPNNSGGQGRPVRPYYIGKPTALGTVTRSDSPDFRSFVQTHLNLAAAVGITRADFFSLPDVERRTAKRVNFFVPSWYDGPVSERKTPNPRGISLICIDIDAAEGARPYRSAPNSLVSQIGEYNFALYETASSNANHPRVRLVVDADLPLEKYKEAVRDIAKRIGLEDKHLNSESLIPNQPMFFPTIFKGDSETDHPLLVFYFDGRPYAAGDLSGDEHVPSAPYVPADAMDFLKDRVEGLTLEDAKAALEFLDPDMAYGDWLSVAAALRHQYIENPDEAYELFDNWSKQGKKYTGDTDTKAKWNSLRPNPIGKNPSTMRTVFHFAKANGWIGMATTARVFESVMSWIRRGCHGSRDPLAEGIKRISAIPFSTPVEQELLLKSLSKVVSDKQRVKISYPTLKAELRDFQKRIKAQASKAAMEKQQWPKWALGLCFVEKRDQFYRPATATYLSPAALDRAYGRFMSGADSDMVAPDETKPRPQEFVLNIVKCPVAYDTTYDPSRPDDTFFTLNGVHYLNSYVRTYPEPSEDKAAYAEQVFREHLGNIIAEPELQEVIVNFLAYLVQQPGKKIRWAILIQGAEGCGKSFFSQAAGAVLGQGHVNDLAFSTIKSQWNDWAVGSQVLSVEEVRASGGNRREMMDKLKPLITNTQVNITRRFCDTYSSENFTNYILYSNHLDALLLDRSDRRYCVIWSKVQRKNQVEKMGIPYFNRLFGMLSTHAAGLRYWLEHYEIPESFSADGHAPRTRYRDLMIDDGEGEMVHLIRDLMDADTNPYLSAKAITSKGLMAIAEIVGGHSANPTSISQCVRAIGYTPTSRAVLCDGERHKLYLPFGSGMKLHELIDYVNDRISRFEAGTLTLEDELL